MNIKKLPTRILLAESLRRESSAKRIQEGIEGSAQFVTDPFDSGFQPFSFNNPDEYFNTLRKSASDEYPDHKIKFVSAKNPLERYYFSKLDELDLLQPGLFRSAYNLIHTAKGSDCRKAAIFFALDQLNPSMIVDVIQALDELEESCLGEGPSHRYATEILGDHNFPLFFDFSAYGEDLLASHEGDLDDYFGIPCEIGEEFAKNTYGENLQNMPKATKEKYLNKKDFLSYYQEGHEVEFVDEDDSGNPARRVFSFK